MTVALKKGTDYQELHLRKYPDGSQRVALDGIWIEGDTIIEFDSLRFHVVSGKLSHMEYIDVLEQVEDVLKDI